MTSPGPHAQSCASESWSPLPRGQWRMGSLGYGKEYLHSFIHSFNTFLLSTSCARLGGLQRKIKQTQFCPHRVGDTDIKSSNR